MDRREHLKLLLAGSVGAGLFMSTSCTTEDQETSRQIIDQGGGQGYGRTAEETEHNERLNADTFFTDVEYSMVSVLADIIIPADSESGGATDAGVPDFIEFTMKDQPSMQLVTRGGLMWLNTQCNQRFGKPFLECTPEEQLKMIDEIAWPDDSAPEMAFGVRFFNRMRDLTSTGYFTSQIGVEYLGYQGNRPGFWDGVPDHVLQNHGLSYDQKVLDETIKEEDRYRVAEWDDDANLL